MAEILQAVIFEVAKSLVAPVGRRCGYVIFFNSYFRQLEDELEKLENARQRVQHPIDDALNDMKPIKAVVERWAKNAETVANKAREMLEDHRRAKKTCFYGRLPNPKARYHLGKEVSSVKKSQQKNKSEGKEIPGRTEEAKNRGSKTYTSVKEKTYVEEEEEEDVHAAEKNEKKTGYEKSA